MTRLIDFILASLMLIVLLPLFVLVAFVLKFTGEGEIFYRQKRIGRYGKPFEVLKFATMLKNSPYMGTGTVTVNNDPRVLPFGRILRKTKVNEMPQLFNVLIGQMSFIGPRPLTGENFSFYSDNVKKCIIEERPGLSGVGSIIFRNEEFILENSNRAKHVYEHLIAPYKGELELWFVENKSVFLYFKLCVLTVAVIFYPRCANLLMRSANFPQASDELKKILGYGF